MPSLNDILRGRTDLLREVPATYASDLDAVIRQLGDSLDRLLAAYDRTGGHFVASSDAIAQAAGSLPELTRALADAGYGDAADRYLDRYRDVVDRVQQTFSVKNVRAEFSAVSLEGLEAARSLDLDMFDAIGTDAMRTVQRSISQAVIYERDYTGFVESLRESIVGSDKRGAPLANRANTFAGTAIAEFDATVTERLADEAGVDRFRYWGPEDTITRPWCRHILHNNRPRTKAEIEAIPKSPTNIYGSSNFVARGGINCRHIWETVPSDEVGSDG